MEKTQIILTVVLLIIEVVAFAWLIIDMNKSKKKQDQIIQLEKQILQVENSIMDLEKKIIERLDENLLINQKKDE